MTVDQHSIDRIDSSHPPKDVASDRPVPLQLLVSFVDRYWAVLLIVGVWQAWVIIKDVNRLVMPGPPDVFSDMAAGIPEYVAALIPTLASAIVGLVVGTAIGAGLALLAQLWRVLTGVVTPGLVILRSIPIVMLVPILTKVLSTGRPSVYAITILIALFPAFVLVASAISSLPSAAERVAIAFGSSKLRRLRYIHAPAAMPAMFTALRISSGTAVLVAIVAEFLTGAGGIGRVFVLARANLETSRTWGVAIASAVASVMLYQITLRLEAAVARRTT